LPKQSSGSAKPKSERRKSKEKSKELVCFDS
jgi:hypothetical protein